MAIDYEVKKKALDLHLQGKGRNEIARILNSQKMRISEATITHLIRQHRNSESSQLQAQQEHDGQTLPVNLSLQPAADTQVPSLTLKEDQQPQPSQLKETSLKQQTPESTPIYDTVTTISNGNLSSTVTPPLGDRIEPANLIEPVKSALEPKNRNSGNPLQRFLTSSTAVASSVLTIGVAAAPVLTTLHDPLFDVSESNKTEPSETINNDNNNNFNSDVTQNGQSEEAQENEESKPLPDSENRPTLTEEHDSGQPIPEENEEDFEQRNDELWATRMFYEIRAAQKERRESY